MLVPEEIRMPAPNDRRDRMLDLARRWRESGQSARAFAQEQGVTAWTLYYWRKRLADERTRRRKLRASSRVSLAPVQVVTSDGEEGQSDVEILLASGDRVRVMASVSVETLRRVVEVLRTRC
jgi:transposase